MEIVLLAGLVLTAIIMTAKKNERVEVLVEVPVRAKRPAGKNR